MLGWAAQRERCWPDGITFRGPPQSAPIGLCAARGARMDVLLLSTYELGHQPLAVARPAAHLLAAGHRVRCQDLAVDRLDEALAREAALIGISVPMHTATRLGVRLAERVRALN